MIKKFLILNALYKIYWQINNDVSRQSAGDVVFYKRIYFFLFTYFVCNISCALGEPGAPKNSLYRF